MVLYNDTRLFALLGTASRVRSARVGSDRSRCVPGACAFRLRSVWLERFAYFALQIKAQIARLNDRESPSRHIVRPCHAASC